MANTKSFIRELNLQNTSINLNKNKSIVSDFNGFNKNTGVWFNGVLSNLYCIDDKAADDIITVDKDIYKIVDDALYKNDVLIKDYSNSNKIKTEILGNIADNVIAYTPLVHIYYEGNNAYVKYDDVIVPVGTYNINAIPYIIIDKAADTWCVLYGTYAVCKGMTEATSFSFTPTAAIYSATASKWYCVVVNSDNGNLYLANVQNKTDTMLLGDTTANIIDGAVTVTGWTTKYRAVQLNSRTVFAAIDDLSVSDTPSVTINKSEKTFMYLKGFWIEDNGFAGLYARPHYSQDGDAIDMSVIPDDFTLYTQAYNAWNKLASIKTKFLSYNSYLTVPYGTSATKNANALGTFSSVDGPTAYLLESCYTKDDADFVTLSGSTASKVKPASSLDRIAATLGEANYPKLLGLVNSNLSPEWLSTDIFDFKLIYNKDALVGISRDNSIVVPWNDVDENTLTITENDIYYYSLNSNAWVHVNVSTENELKAIKIGNNLLLNSLVDNCYNKSLSTYSVDTTLTNFKTFKPRVGLINMYGIHVHSFMVRGSTTNYKLGNNWLTYMLEAIKNGDTYYLSIVSENNGPIWAAAQLMNYKDTNVRKEGWQWTVDLDGVPSIDIETIDYAYILNAMVLNGRPSIDAYTSSSGSVLSYFKSWYQGIAKYNNKLADTEKSMTEPTYYNLSPNLDIMTFIDGFNTIALIKVGNNTVQLLVKESELLLVYNLLSNVGNISDYFVLQGQQYGIINNYINKVDMVNGQVVSQTPITSVEGLKFLGNTDKQAFFFSQMNKTILYFAADNTLEFLADATEIDNNTTTVFAKQTNDIFLLLNDKVVVFTNSGSMFEILSRAEYITFGENSWSDGNKTWSYYKISPDQERVPIELETLWYGDTVNRKMMNVDCVYVELYDDNYMPGKFEISFDGLVNNTVSTKKQLLNIKEKDYDRITKTYYLRYQPAYQNCAAFKLNIKSDIAIKRIAIGYTSEGVSTISKNNI